MLSQLIFHSFFLDSPIGTLSVIDIWQLVQRSGVLVKLVLLLLLFLSITTWAIIIFKYFQLQSARRRSLQFLDIFWERKRLDSIFKESEPLAGGSLVYIFHAGYQELLKIRRGKSPSPESNGSPLSPSIEGGGIENIRRALYRAATTETSRLESHLTFLATTASAAPFIGLFGTVWGIMKTFQGIGQTGSASLAVVAPGISEALIATAFGLAAAIPAVMAYNFFINRVRYLSNLMEGFSQDFLNICERHFI